MTQASATWSSELAMVLPTTVVSLSVDSSKGLLKRCLMTGMNCLQCKLGLVTLTLGWPLPGCSAKSCYHKQWYRSRQRPRSRPQLRLSETCQQQAEEEEVTPAHRFRISGTSEPNVHTPLLHTKVIDVLGEATVVFTNTVQR